MSANTTNKNEPQQGRAYNAWDGINARCRQGIEKTQHAGGSQEIQRSTAGKALDEDETVTEIGMMAS